MDHASKRAPRRRLWALILLAGAGAAAMGWGEEGHRAVTLLALDAAAPALPAWLSTPDMRERAAYESIEPDRYRSIRTPVMGHENGPEHYLDVEYLDQYGLTLRTLPRLRYDYAGLIVHAHESKRPGLLPYDAAKDSDRSRLFPGFAPYAIMEHYEKLRASLKSVRLLETVGNAAEASPALTQARANVIYHVGALSHFVGDLAQPLHTTKHHHGWVGDNPADYTTSYGFHAYIDTGVVRRHGITYETMKDGAVGALTIQSDDPWPAVIAHLERSFVTVEPLYVMQKDGTLDADAGKAFIESRLRDGAATLAGLLAAAWEGSVPTDTDVRFFTQAREGAPK